MKKRIRPSRRTPFMPTRPSRCGDHARSRSRRGVAIVEFAFICPLIIGVILAVLELGRVGMIQHGLDQSANLFAWDLTTLTGTNSARTLNPYAPTPLDPSGPTTAGTTGQQIQTYLTQVFGSGSAIAATPLTTTNGAFAAAPCGSNPVTATTTLINASIVVSGTPNLSCPTQVTVTVTQTTASAVGLFLKGFVYHLTSTSTIVTPEGQLVNG